MQVSIQDPIIQTIIIELILVFAFLITLRKNSSTQIFPIEKTNELKGFAILTIVLGHIGFGLAVPNTFLYPLSILAGVGVNLFLFLSGYGLTKSSINTKLSVLTFYKKRLIRLYIPLWITLISILVFSYLLLKKTFPFNEVLESFFGFFPRADLFINIDSPLWYFTFILFYYLFFPLVFIKKFPYISALILLILSYVFINISLPINKDLVNLYKLHTLAFPLGMIFASLNFSKINILKIKLNYLIRVGLIILLFFPFVFFTINSGVGHGLATEQFRSLITMFLIITIFILNPLKSVLFILFGLYSYEIYLIHWPLMYRFDFLFKYFPAWVSVILYLGIFLGVGFLFNKLTALISKKIKI